MSTTLIVNGQIVDGTGNPWFYGDVLLEDEHIAAIEAPGSISEERAETVIDAKGHVVAPGFIDIQSHSILTLLVDGRSLSKITQGVTTEIMGEFWTPAPFGGEIHDQWAIALVHRLEDEDRAKWSEIARQWTRFGHWLRDLEQHGVSVNIGSFVGGGTIREYGMGQIQGEPSEDQLNLMRKATAESMEDGAFGVATALIYPPGAYATTSELTEIMKVVAAYNGVHITHMRNESVQMLEAFDETLQIARDSGLISELYHLKASGSKSWPLMSTLIQRINTARAEGIDIAADMYPYDGSGTSLTANANLPDWVSEGGRLMENLDDDATRHKILEEMRANAADPQIGIAADKPSKVILAEFATDELATRFRGKTLQQAADELGMDWHEAALWLLRTDRSAIFSMNIGMSEENMKLQFQQEWIKWGSDAGGVDPAWMEARGLVHPRAYGTFPRIVGHYSRDLGWIPLEDAVRKGTSAVADRLGIRDRGTLRAGMKADVIVFDPATIIDHSTYTDPHQLSTGVRDVWVNGERVLADSTHTGAKPGQQVLHRG